MKMQVHCVGGVGMDSEVDRKYCMLQIARVKARREAEESENHADTEANPTERCQMQDGLTVHFAPLGAAHRASGHTSVGSSLGFMPRKASKMVSMRPRRHLLRWLHRLDRLESSLSRPAGPPHLCRTPNNAEETSVPIAPLKKPVR